MYATIIGRWDSYLMTTTQKYDWVAEDSDYNTIRGIIERLAAAEIRWMIDKRDTDAAVFWKSAMQDLEMLLGKSSVAGQPLSNGINVAAPHGSYPANLAGSHFTGLKKQHPGGFLVNSELGIYYPYRF